MNDLTSTLLVNDYNYEVEEWDKQGNELQFDSGKEQRVTKYSIPSIEIGISYRGLTYQEYAQIRNAYENNHSNTFILDFNDNYSIEAYVEADYIVNQGDYIRGFSSVIDLRPELMTTNSAVWVFREFRFSVDARTRLYSGTIKLLTSVFFNFTAYQDLFNQSSSYTMSPSSDENFLDVLDEVSPYQSVLGYTNNALFSNIGQSVRHAKNKGGLKRTWTLLWLINETQFIRLLTFYRKKAGIMGVFGFPDFGTNSGILFDYLEADYIENQGDYVFQGGADNLSNARFAQDSFKYQKRVDGLYTCQADFIEVKI